MEVEGGFPMMMRTVWSSLPPQEQVFDSETHWQLTLRPSPVDSTVVVLGVTLKRMIAVTPLVVVGCCWEE